MSMGGFHVSLCFLHFLDSGSEVLISLVRYSPRSFIQFWTVFLISPLYTHHCYMGRLLVFFFCVCVLTLYPTMFLKLCASCQRFLVKSLGSFKINHLSQFLKNFFPYLYAFYSLFLLLQLRLEFVNLLVSLLILEGVETIDIQSIYYVGVLIHAILLILWCLLSWSFFALSVI